MKYYTKTGCEFECAVKNAIQLCQCLPWFYPNNFTDVPICEMFGFACFDKVMYLKKYYKMCPDICFEDCNGLVYDVVSSASRLSPEDVSH